MGIHSLFRKIETFLLGGANWYTYCSSASFCRLCSLTKARLGGGDDVAGEVLDVVPGEDPAVDQSVNTFVYDHCTV